MTGPEQALPGWWRRGRVVVPTATLLLLGWASNSARVGAAPGVAPGEAAVFVLGPAAGPFVGLFGPVIGFDADPVGYCLAVGLPLLTAIAAHPAYPSWPTGFATVAGLVLWFLLGLSFIHQ